MSAVSSSFVSSFRTSFTKETIQQFLTFRSGIRLFPDRMSVKQRIRGKIICIGAEDDVLWDTCRYIRRMEERLETTPHDAVLESWLYEHGTHFAFPQSLLKQMLPLGSGLLVSLMFKAGKEHSKECRETREDIDRRLKRALSEW